MITILLIICLIISLGLLVATFKLIQILQKKISVYEQWIVDVKDDVSHAIEDMRAIDKSATFVTSFNSTGKGVFESDDQVGQVFKELLGVVEELDDKIQ